MVDSSAQSLPAQRLWDRLATIDDPEMPISIVDLGIVERAEVDGRVARIRITPTFTGCPALQLIDDHIRAELGKLDGIDKVEIEHVFDPPWSVERISDAGRERLRRHGVSVPGQRYVQLSVASRQLVACPYCGSEKTRMESAFGPTRCRMIYYCSACHNPFEHIKAV